MLTYTHTITCTCKCKCISNLYFFLNDTQKDVALRNAQGCNVH